MIKFSGWRHGQKLWRHNLYFKVPLFQEGLELPILLVSSKLELFSLKQSLKTQKKLKELKIMYQNAIYIFVSWYSKICRFPLKKFWSQQNSKACVTWFIYFLNLLKIRYNCAKFYHCRICVTDFREGGLFAPSIREQSRKGPSWIRLNRTHLNKFGSMWVDL